MQKFNIKCVEIRSAVFTIEANSELEAVDLVKNRIRNDDYFCDELAEMYENGVDDEVITAKPADKDDTVDYTYAEMIGEDEEEDE